MRVSGQFYLFYEKISHTQKAQKVQNSNKQLSLRCFYMHKKHKKHKNNKTLNKELLLRCFLRA